VWQKMLSLKSNSKNNTIEKPEQKALCTEAADAKHKAAISAARRHHHPRTSISVVQQEKQKPPPAFGR